MLFKGEVYDKKRLIIDIVFTSISFVLFILAASTFYNLSLRDRIIEDILANWDANLIYDITEIRETCERGYEVLFIDRFPGTKEGCNCLGRSGNSIPWKFSDKVNPFPCSYDLLNSNCYKVLPVAPKTLKVWQTKVVCLKRSNMTYYDYIRTSVFINDDCPIGYTQCGQIDTQFNKLCLKGRVCPINKIAISSYEVPNDYSYQQIRLFDNHFMYFTSYGRNETIPVEFSFSEGNKCLDPNEKNSLFDPYILDNEMKKYYCSTYENYLKYDERYVKLDSMSTRELLDQNGLLTPLLDLPHYPKEQLDSVTSLFTRTYIGWNISCLANERTTPERLRKATQTIQTNNKLNIALFVFVTLSFAYLLIVSLAYKRVYPKKRVQINILSGISLGLFLIVFALSISAFILIDDIDLGLFSCGDTLSSVFFKTLYSKILTTKVFYLLIGILFISFLAVYVILYVIAAVKNYRNPQSNLQPEEDKHNQSPEDRKDLQSPHKNDKEDNKKLIENKSKVGVSNNNFIAENKVYEDANKDDEEEEEDEEEDAKEEQTAKDKKYNEEDLGTGRRRSHFGKNRVRRNRGIGSDKWGFGKDLKDDRNIVEYK